MSILLSSFVLLAAADALPATDVTLATLPCTIENAYYENPVEPIWTIGFDKPKIRPSAASDLLMMITGDAFVRHFSFDQSQGFGGVYLQIADDDEELGQPMPKVEQPEDAIAFHGFAIGANKALVTLLDAPQAGDPAPAAIYVPDVSRYFWYDEKFEDMETGKTLPGPVDMPRAIFTGKCSPKP